MEYTVYMAVISGHKQSLIFKEKAHMKVYLQSGLSVCPKQIYGPFTLHLFLLSVWDIFILVCLCAYASDASLIVGCLFSVSHHKRHVCKMPRQSRSCSTLKNASGFWFQSVALCPDYYLKKHLNA